MQGTYVDRRIYTVFYSCIIRYKEHLSKSSHSYYYNIMRFSYHFMQFFKNFGTNSLYIVRNFLLKTDFFFSNS